MRLLLTLLAAALAFVAPAGAAAKERITYFRSDVAVQKDGSLLVDETIRIRSTGETIRRGIQRDFPTRYRQGLRQVRAGFDVTGVQRDGAPEPWKKMSIGNGVRIRIGDPDRLLEPGEHSYTISYRTTRQIGFFVLSSF